LELQVISERDHTNLDTN